jgi:uncharacterized repeat protein (TIGR03803 family)
MKTLRPLAAASFLLSAVTVLSQAQVFKKVNFEGTNGAWPTYMSLIQGIDGNYYGVTKIGGTNGSGNIFRLTATGRVTSLYSFCGTPPNCSDGAFPEGGLVLGIDGSLYGTTSWGGNGPPCEAGAGCGTVFKLSPSRQLTSLYEFANSDGESPMGNLTFATNGSIYGTTESGPNEGTIYRMSEAGELTTLHIFDGYDGATPYAGLVEATDGTLYGTTDFGGAYDYGTVFRISRNGKLSRVYSFCSQPSCADGAEPEAGLIQANDGSLYGTTSGGIGGYEVGPGTVFRITPDGSFSTLHTFCSQVNCADGANPEAPLIQATDGNFYGTTRGGGNLKCNGGFGCGTVFRMTPTGVVTTLHSFDNNDGNEPYGGLLQSTTGLLYGTTTIGGHLACFLDIGCGSLFSLDVGLGPFVTFVRSFGRVGGVGGILGQGFIGATSVSLNGTAADFTVVSDTFIKATVPPGATSGYVTVTTPSGVLKSNVPFQVIP